MRDQTGYAFSRLGGTPRPVDGLSPPFGGSAARVELDHSGSQWSNASEVQAIDRQATIGSAIRLRIRRQDGDSSAKVQFFLDRDRNPFNDNNARLVAARTFDASEQIVTARVNGSSSGVAPGNYYVYTKTLDPGGHVRYSYSRRIKLVAPAAAQTAAFHLFSWRSIETGAKPGDATDLPLPE